MSIKSSTFGGVPLSGEETMQFVKQLHDEKPKPAAIDFLKLEHVVMRNINKYSSLVLALSIYCKPFNLIG